MSLQSNIHVTHLSLLLVFPVVHMYKIMLTRPDSSAKLPALKAVEELKQIQDKLRDSEGIRGNVP
jgi:hypothetical protein